MPTLRFVQVDVGAAVDVMVTLDRLRSEREGRRGGDIGEQSDGDAGLDFDASDAEAFDEVDDLAYDSDLFEDGGADDDDLFHHAED